MHIHGLDYKCVFLGRLPFTMLLTTNIRDLGTSSQPNDYIGE